MVAHFVTNLLLHTTPCNDMLLVSMEQFQDIIREAETEAEAEAIQAKAQTVRTVIDVDTPAVIAVTAITNIAMATAVTNTYCEHKLLSTRK